MLFTTEEYSIYGENKVILNHLTCDICKRVFQVPKLMVFYFKYHKLLNVVHIFAYFALIHVCSALSSFPGLLLQDQDLPMSDNCHFIFLSAHQPH